MSIQKQARVNSPFAVTLIFCRTIGAFWIVNLLF